MRPPTALQPRRHRHQATEPSTATAARRSAEAVRPGCRRPGFAPGGSPGCASSRPRLRPGCGSRTAPCADRQGPAPAPSSVAAGWGRGPRWARPGSGSAGSRPAHRRGRRADGSRETRARRACDARPARRSAPSRLPPPRCAGGGPRPSARHGSGGTLPPAGPGRSERSPVGSRSADGLRRNRRTRRGHRPVRARTSPGGNRSGPVGSWSCRRRWARGTRRPHRVPR